MKTTILVIASIAVSFLLGQCIGEKTGEEKALKTMQEEEHNRIVEKYVLVDKKGILHISNSCIHLIKENVGVEYKEMELLNKSDLNKVCPFCVDAEDYEKITNTLKEKRTNSDDPYKEYIVG